MLTPAWTQLRYHEQQARLWRSKERIVLVCAGRGSGKTELARRRVVRYLPVKKPWPDPEYFYAMPTVAQAHRVAWEKLKGLVPQHWVSNVSESSMVITTVFGSKLRVFGLDKPMRAEGLQYDGGVIDERADVKRGVVNRTFRPALTHRRGWLWEVGVPKRFGAGALEFRKRFERYRREPDENHRSFTWPSWDILTPKEIAEAKEECDEKEFREQYGGVWETVSGQVYYAYSRDNVNDSIAYDPDRPLIVGSDFNVDPMAWVIMQQVGDKLHVFDELWKRNTNTQASLADLHSRYPDHSAGWWFFGDAAGRSRHTSASASDYAQIKQDARFVGSHVVYPKANPAVADRVASVNKALRSASGSVKLLIHPRCVNLLRDLEYLAYKEGSRNIDESDPNAKHITDALGYVVHRLMPVRSSAIAGSIGVVSASQDDLGTDA